MTRLEKICLATLIIFVSIEPKEEITSLIVAVLIAVSGGVFIAVERR
jgi:hypothetical protein